MAPELVVLRKIRCRSTVQLFLDHAVNAALVWAGLWTVLAGACVLGGGPPPALHTLAIVPAIALATGAALALWHRPSLAQCARAIDARAATRDRFTTALAFHEATSAFQTAAVEECRRFIAAFDPNSVLCLQVPRRLPWLVVPLVSLALLEWHVALKQTPPAALPPVPTEVVAQATALRELAVQCQKVDEPALAQLAMEMARAADRMLQPAAGDPLRNALHELSLLEAALATARQAGGTLPDLEALVEALRSIPALRPVAAALERGAFADAAAQLQQAAAQSGSRAQLTAALRHALERLRGMPPTPLREPLQRAVAGGKDQAQALEQLAAMLRQMTGTRSAVANRISTEVAGRLIAQLQEMKSAMAGRNARHGAAQEGLLFMPGEGEANDQPKTARVLDFSDLPGGRPGSEHDAGTTEKVAGTETSPPAPDALETRLAGVLGNGETLQALVAAAGTGAQARHRYQALHAAAASAAEQEVTREDTPLGARFVVKRYFESIRPAQ